MAGADNFSRRQDLPKTYALNGAVYVAECRWLETSRTFLTRETAAYRMPRERSVDIDNEMDLLVASVLLSEQTSGARTAIL